MESARGRSRYRSPSAYGRRPMSQSRSASRRPPVGNPFAGAIASGRANLGYTRRINRSARLARAMLNSGTAGFLGLEKKFFDTAVAATAIASAAAMTGAEYDPTALPGAVACLNAMAQGDGEQNRDGRKVVLKSCLVKGRVIRSATEDTADPPPPLTLFLALVLDTQTNGAQLNSEDVYKNLAATATGSVIPIRNLLFGDRFKILRTEEINMDCQTLAVDATDSHATSGLAKCFEWFVPLDLPVNFNSGTTAVIANVIDNSLHVLAFASTAGGLIEYNARVRFLG